MVTLLLYLPLEARHLSTLVVAIKAEVIVAVLSHASIPTMGPPRLNSIRTPSNSVSEPLFQLSRLDPGGAAED